MKQPVSHLEVLCAGSSMYPGLRSGDRLSVVPYGRKQPRVGDVVVFQRADGDRRVIHRVYRITMAGLITRGDNNPAPDTEPVGEVEILGYVAAAFRGRTALTVRNGYPGRIEACRRRMAKRVFARVSGIAHPIYHLLIRSRIFSRLFSRWIRLQVYRFGRSDAFGEMHLYLNGKPVGRRAPNGAWRIRRPYRLLVDETSLP